MVSSDAETGMGDCSVGTIVWVRRRNGSWWPGKILGPDELSASHLMSPRSGTPVKLLGREDASVDWYNLEKSKRVKPFRCGEFDDCIERAGASQGMPPKKREKYARREDAILHALELEKQLLEKKYGKSGISSNCLNGVGKDTTAPPDFSCDSKMDLSLEEKIKAQRDDKSSYVRPRMKGLQDLSLGPVPSEYEISSLPASNGSHKHAPDDGIHVALEPEIGSKFLFEKRKRSQERHAEESLAKKRDKHVPLVQVLEGSAKSPLVNSLQSQDDDSSAPPLIQREVVDPVKVGIGASTAVKFDESFDYNNMLPDQVELSTPKSERRDSAFPSGSGEDTETDSSGTESLISDTYDAMTTLSEEAEDIELIPKSFGRFEENESMSDGEGSVRVSKWQQKGKRNSRTLMKRYPVGCSHWLSFINWNDEADGYWEQADEVMYGGGMMLIDVDIQVQSGYQREHVPMISLMSKLNDTAIVGHPIPIETLLESDIGYDTMLQPWRTARRTAKCRVARGVSEQHAADEASRKGIISKRPHRRSGSGFLSSSQKIKMLSSIGGREQETQGEVKPESLVAASAVACIPVKLVFSRLHEELLARHQ